jgi:nitric oxide dioxygenase
MPNKIIVTIAEAARDRVTPDQVKAIQDSFKLVAPISEQAAALFYGRLFEIAPTSRRCFAAT